MTDANAGAETAPSTDTTPSDDASPEEDGAAENATESTATATPAATAVPTTAPEPTVNEAVPEPTPLDLPVTTAPAEVGTRMCTVDVAFDEVLNVRDEPSLDGFVVARVPGLTCPLTVPNGVDLDADWLPVIYETAHVRHEGYVSNEFVEPGFDDIEGVALQWMQAVLDGTDRSPFEYGPALAETDTSIIEALRGGVAVPFFDTKGFACILAGDVSVECAVQVNDPGGTPVGQFVVFGSQVGANGYDESFFPDDFGDLPLVDAFRECPFYERCPFEGPDFATIAIDSDAAIGGARLGMTTEAALLELAVFLGPPTSDTDWIVGCPLDGEDLLNERYVEWGGLTVAFTRWEEAPDGELWYWFYDFDSPDGDPAITSSIRLPGRNRDGATLDAISESTRLPIEIHELLQEPVIFGPGWTLFGEEAGDTTRLTRAAVPFIGICD